MTPERIFALKVDAVVRFILATILIFALVMGAVEVCLAGPAAYPGIPPKIGSVGDSGPGFAPMQRSVVGPTTPETSIYPASTLLVYDFADLTSSTSQRLNPRVGDSPYLVQTDSRYWLTPGIDAHGAYGLVQGGTASKLLSGSDWTVPSDVATLTISFVIDVATQTTYSTTFYTSLLSKNTLLGGCYNAATNLGWVDDTQLSALQPSVVDGFNILVYSIGSASTTIRTINRYYDFTQTKAAGRAFANESISFSLGAPGYGTLSAASKKVYNVAFMSGDADIASLCAVLKDRYPLDLTTADYPDALVWLDASDSVDPGVGQIMTSTSRGLLPCSLSQSTESLKPLLSSDADGQHWYVPTSSADFLIGPSTLFTGRDIATLTVVTAFKTGVPRTRCNSGNLFYRTQDVLVGPHSSDTSWGWCGAAGAISVSGTSISSVIGSGTMGIMRLQIASGSVKYWFNDVQVATATGAILPVSSATLNLGRIGNGYNGPDSYLRLYHYSIYDTTEKALEGISTLKSRYGL